VTEGDTVSAGQLLAALTALDPLEKRKAADELALRQAELELANANLTLELTRLRADEATRELELQIQENLIALAQARYDAVALDIQNLDDAIAEAKLTAPIDGQILSVSIQSGSNVAAFRPVMTLADTDHLEVGAIVQSSRLAGLAEGMPVTIAAANRPGLTVTGTIRRIPYQGSGTGSTDPLLRVALDVPAQESGLALEDQVEVTAVIAAKQDVIWLPAQAIRTYQNNRFVVVREDDIERRVDVTIGVEGGGRVEIVSGLEVGQVVVGP
jgi:RND family efflux transporter MFP subunit